MNTTANSWEEEEEAPGLSRETVGPLLMLAQAVLGIILFIFLIVRTLFAEVAKRFQGAVSRQSLQLVVQSIKSLIL